MRLVDERLDDEYLEGVENFLDYAFSHAGRENEIRCPCIKCCNTYSHPCDWFLLSWKCMEFWEIIPFGTIGEVATTPQTVSEGEGDEERQAESDDEAAEAEPDNVDEDDLLQNSTTSRRNRTTWWH